MYGYQHGEKLPELDILKNRVETCILSIVKFDKSMFLNHSVYSFLQVWPSTALGFGGVGGDAMTTRYTTVFRSYILSYNFKNSEDSEYSRVKGKYFYTVFFDSRFAYFIESDGKSEKIEYDIHKESMKSVKEAIYYES